VERSGAAPGTLYLVALPIGNLRDITYRAVDVLRSVELIAAEDTRDFRAIQREYGISTRVISYHDFNEQARVPQLLERLSAGESVALVSDAGTPLINDPGFRIVAAAVEAGVPVTSVPGPSAVVTALAASGLTVAPFLFLGFPPRTSRKRRAFLAPWASLPATLIFYESPHRLIDSLDDALAVLGERDACLARNLTKPHERYQRGTLPQLIAELRAEEIVRGETTVLVAGSTLEADDRQESVAPATVAIAALLHDGLDSRTILARVMEDYGLKRREAYELILQTRTALAESGLPNADPSA
jgi:16S rRNA (cytidine1402-2'-O)-methyltransferase